MKRSKRLTTAIGAFVLSLGWCAVGAQESLSDIASGLPEDTNAQAIDVAICLDTSSSMNDLIEAARLKLWEIVNDLALLQPAPRLRVALLTYGNAGNPPKNGWVRIETPLTEDFDLVSQRLFELECKGGSEYVARVLQTALDELEWTDSTDALKLVFVAGNEPADQDKEVDFRAVATESENRDFALHAIYCGDAEHEQAMTWKELARSADGKFAAIDHRTVRALVETPGDEELAKLGASLNDTFIPMGESGKQGRENQLSQDKNAQSLSVAVAASRAQTKASPLYSADWDLVQAVEQGRVDLFEIDESELPKVMQEMSPGERVTYVEELILEREEIRQRIAELSEQRRRYVANKAKAKNQDDSQSFDGVVRQAIRQQIEQKGLRTPEP
jgi:hypothetical protein